MLYQIIKIFKFLLFKISIHKTIYFNFKYFGFIRGLVFPVFISKKVELLEVSGVVEVQKFKTGVVRLGFGKMGNYPQKTSSFIFENNGKIIFKGDCTIGIGSTISNHGLLIFGEKFNITADGHIICFKQISFGNNCLISWNTQFMDSDQHNIYDKNHNLLNPDNAISIGDNCWICNGVNIQKGVSCKNNCIIGSNSKITKSINQENVIIGDNGKILKTDITWEL